VYKSSILTSSKFEHGAFIDSCMNVKRCKVILCLHDMTVAYIEIFVLKIKSVNVIDRIGGGACADTQFLDNMSEVNRHSVHSEGCIFISSFPRIEIECRQISFQCRETLKTESILLVLGQHSF
jgi:hypothetical protein